jgi:hypothetical protein
MVKLTQENLYDYFAVATEQDSAAVVGKKLFDFVDRQSDTLIVTIGDSWTWGADLSQIEISGAHLIRLEDDDYRIKHVYGNVLAEKLAADFLNLGELGAGNWYIVRKLKELLRISNALTYKKILVFGIWTELGRDFNSTFDIHVDYRSWLLSNVRQSRDYYGFMNYIHVQIANAVLDLIKKFDHRFKFNFGTNFVDPIGNDVLSNYWIERTWLQVICDESKKTYEPVQCYTVFPWCIEKFNMVFDVAPELNRLEWLEWITEVTAHANIRAAICFRDNINFGNLLHPSAVNHQRWADYILGKLHATA